MSDPSNDNKILLKFELQVPIQPGQSPVIIQSPPTPDKGTGDSSLAQKPVAAPQKPTQPAAVRPTPAIVAPVTTKGLGYAIVFPQDRAKVKKTGTNEGIICVTAAQDNFPCPPDDVYLQVMALSASVTPVPIGTTPPGAVPATKIGLTFAKWEHQSLGPVPCVAPTSGLAVPNIKVVVWRKYNHFAWWKPAELWFRGECHDTETDCGVVYSQAPPARPAKSSKVLDTVPGSLLVVGQGFKGPLAPLNQTLKISRSQTKDAGLLIWQARDADPGVQVELRASACGCDPIELRLKCGGRTIVYVAPRNHFNPLGMNRFSFEGDKAKLAGCVYPNNLQVIPV